ncbi:hypothetical protein [Streptomyces sp. NPDC093594]|uniref:hypothetical protein n=1 Tax=Streptomyces sp. NPDC093594 TaxID=3155305 RepID=UPI00344F07F8
MVLTDKSCKITQIWVIVGGSMYKAWKFRALSVLAAPAIAFGFSSEALAYDGNTVVYLGSYGASAATMIHVDNGDTFRVYDDRSDGHGVRGCLERYLPGYGDYTTIHCSYNGGGINTYSYFQHDVKQEVDGYPTRYRMKVCTVDGADDTSPVACSSWKDFVE